MKKSLIALAALAVVGVASAQSSVTLYGVADVAVGRLDVMSGGSSAGLKLPNDDFQVIGSNTLNNGNSRFGLRGVEDLGGGLKAGFNFEGKVNLQDGTGGTGLFDRAANLSLMTNMGTLSVGRMYTPAFYSIASWELTGTANYSAVGNQFGFGGTGPGTGPRDSNAIKFDSANYNGLSVSASIVPKGNANYGDAGGNKDKYDVAATYARGPITASLDYNKVVSGNAGLVMGAKYDLGTIQVAASYNNLQKGDDTVLARGYSLGASVGVGPVTLTADIAHDTQYSDTDFVLETKYALSKRTFIYGVFMLDGYRAPSAEVTGATANSYLTGHVNAESVNGYSLGIRHNF